VDFVEHFFTLGLAANLSVSFLNSSGFFLNSVEHSRAAAVVSSG
jgi:hypothetical protein